MKFTSVQSRPVTSAIRHRNVQRPALGSLILAASLALAGCNDKPDPALLATTACWIDSINGKGDEMVVVERNGRIELSGWAADSSSGTAPEKRVLQLLDPRGNIVLAQMAGERSERADVAELLKQPGYKGAGFKGAFPAAPANPGEYGLSIAMFRAGAGVLCLSGKRVAIR